MRLRPKRWYDYPDDFCDGPRPPWYRPYDIWMWRRARKLREHWRHIASCFTPRSAKWLEERDGLADERADALAAGLSAMMAMSSFKNPWANLTDKAKQEILDSREERERAARFFRGEGE